MKKFLPAALALLCLVSLAINLLQWRETGALRRNLENSKAPSANAPSTTVEASPEAPAGKPPSSGRLTLKSASPNSAAPAEEENGLAVQSPPVGPKSLLRGATPDLPPSSPTPPGPLSASPVRLPLAATTPSRPISPAPAARGPSDLTQALGRVFTDPSLKGALLQKQALAARLMYADLAHELGLDAEHADQLTNLLAERQTAKTSRTMAMLNQSSGGASLEEIGKAGAEIESEYQQRLRTFLGESGYAKYQVYEKSVGERMLLQQFQQSAAAIGQPLEEGQRRSLLQIMIDTHAGVAGADLPSSGNSEDQLQRFFAVQDEANEKMFKRAEAILQPAQLTAFRQLIRDWTQTQRSSLQMSRALFQGGR